MNKKKLLIALLLAFSMTTGISYAEEEIISPNVEVNDGQVNPENNSKQENSTEKANQKENQKENKKEQSQDEKQQHKKVLTDENVAERVEGHDRFESANKIHDEFFEKTQEVVLTSSEVFADAISSGNITDGKMPILYTEGSKLNEKTREQLKNRNIKKVHIIGGEKTISKDVEEFLKKMGIEVERIDGHDRYAVNAKLAKNKKDADTLVFASGENYADSLSSVGLANKTKSPILLVQKNTLPTSIKEYLSSIDKTKILKSYIVGGTNSISDSVKAEIDSILNLKSTRIAGADRYKTSVEVSKIAYPKAKKAIFTTGEVYADALAAAPVSQKIDAPIVLVPRNNIQLEQEANSSNKTQTHENYLKNLNVEEKSYVFGGRNSISDDCFTNIKNALLKKDLIKVYNTDRNLFRLKDYVVNNKAVSLLTEMKDAAKKVIDVAVNKILKVVKIEDKWVNLSFNGISGWVRPEGFKYYNPQDFATVHIKVPNIMNQITPKSQRGIKQKAAPIGCEPTAMYHALQAKGYALDYTYNEFLNQLPMNTNDNDKGFSKNPYVWDEYYHTRVMATYMNPEPMTKFANRFANGKAENISGSNMRDILAELQNGNAIMYYGTLRWEKPRWSTNVYGKRFFANNHGICINGYNPKTNRFYLADPWYSNEITKSYAEVSENYLSRQMAVVVR